MILAAAVDGEGLGGDEAGVRGGAEGDGAGDVFGFADAAHYGDAGEVVAQFGPIGVRIALAFLQVRMLRAAGRAGLAGAGLGMGVLGRCERW